MQLQLLGPLRLALDGRPLPAPRTAKGAALLAMLAGEPGAQHRERLAALLWEEAPADKAAASLRVALSDLRSLLGPALESERGLLRLRLQEGDRVDLRQLAAWEAGRRLAPEALAEALGEGGALLAGVDFADAPELARWLEAERRRWSALQARAAIALAEAQERAGALAEAEAGLRQALRKAPERERGHRRLIRLLARQARYDEALEAYAHCREALAEALDLPPEPATERLRERVLVARGRRPVAPLPAPGGPFFGRERELGQLASWLRRPETRLISLLGPGGAGKTRLAIEAARRSASAFLDGLAYVELEGLAAGTPIEQVLVSALGLGSSRADPRAQLRQALAEREMLLVLDNFEHQVEQAELCAALLAGAPDLRILITSREALGLPGEQRLPIAGLPWPEAEGEPADPERHAAAALFAAAARRVRPDFDPTAEADPIGALCRRLEGLPLALELAAAWLEVGDCRGIVETLARDPRRLEAEGRGFPRRQASMQAVFDGSWQRLGPEERLAAARASVFRGGFDAEAADRVARLDPSLLRRLVRHSMITAQADGRFRMHALLRELAASRLAEQPALEAKLRDAHARHFLGLWAREGAELFGSRSAEASARMLPELDDAGAAWRWALQRGRIDLLEGSLEAWLRLFRLRGPYAKALALFDETAAQLEAGSPGTPGRERLLARLHGNRAYLCFRTGRGSEAESLAAEGLRLAEATADATAESFARWVLGIQRLGEGRLEAAEDDFARGQAAAVVAGALELELEHRWQGAVLAYYRDDLSSFEQEAEAILARCRAADLRQLEGRVRESLASVLSRRGEARGAEAHLSAAGEISEAMGDRLGAINVLGSRAELALHAGQLDRARHLAREALRRSLDLGAEESAVVMRWGLATVQLAADEPQRAEAELERCLEAARAGGFRYWEACARTSLAQARRHARDPEGARAQLAEAAPIWDEIGHAWGQAFRWLEAGCLALEEDRLDEADQALRHAERLAAEAQDPIRALEVELALARLLAARGDRGTARRQLEALAGQAEARAAARIATAARRRADELG